MRRELTASTLIIITLLSLYGTYNILQAAQITGRAASESNTGKVNFTLEYGNDVVSPRIILNKPNGTVTTVSDIPINYSINDTQLIETCGFNITFATSGVLTGNSLNELNCTETLALFSVSAAGDYTFHLFANDTAGNLNITSNNFTVSTTGTGGSGGSGGGGGGAEVPLTFTPAIIKLKLTTGNIEGGQIIITNQGNVPAKIYLSTENIERYLQLLETTFKLNSRSQYVVNYQVLVNQEGTYLGRIIVTNGNKRNDIPVILEAESKEQHLDVSLDIPAERRTINSGEAITGTINVYNLNKEETTVDIDYFVKDFNNKVITQTSERVQIKDQFMITKTLELPPELPAGQYVYIVQASTEGQVATASELFTIAAKRIVIEQPIELQKPSTTVVWALIIVVMLTLGWIYYEYKKIRKIEGIMHLPHYEDKLKKEGISPEYLEQAIKLVQQAEKAGYTREQLRKQFDDANWPEYAIDYVLNKAEEKQEETKTSNLPP